MKVTVYIKGIKSPFKYTEKDEKGGENLARRILMDGAAVRLEGGSSVFYPPHRVQRVEVSK